VYSLCPEGEERGKGKQRLVKRSTGSKKFKSHPTKKKTKKTMIKPVGNQLDTYDSSIYGL
jgi:hypothetical protein